MSGYINHVVTLQVLEFAEFCNTYKWYARRNCNDNGTWVRFRGKSVGMIKERPHRTIF